MEFAHISLIVYTEQHWLNESKDKGIFNLKMRYQLFRQIEKSKWNLRKNREEAFGEKRTVDNGGTSINIHCTDSKNDNYYLRKMRQINKMCVNGLNDISE